MNDELWKECEARISELQRELGTLKASVRFTSTGQIDLHAMWQDEISKRRRAEDEQVRLNLVLESIRIIVEHSPTVTPADALQAIADVFTRSYARTLVRSDIERRRAEPDPVTAPDAARRE